MYEDSREFRRGGQLRSSWFRCSITAQTGLLGEKSFSTTECTDCIARGVKMALCSCRSITSAVNVFSMGTEKNPPLTGSPLRRGVGQWRPSKRGGGVALMYHTRGPTTRRDAAGTDRYIIILLWFLYGCTLLTADTRVFLRSFFKRDFCSMYILLVLCTSGYCVLKGCWSLR